MHGGGYEDLGLARVDVDRVARTGGPEVGYGAGKTAEPGVALLARLGGRLVNVSVEYEDVRAAPDALGLQVKEVPQATTAAARPEDAAE